MMQAHAILEDYGYNPHTGGGGGGHEGVYTKPVYNLSRLCHSNPHLNPAEKSAQNEGVGISQQQHHNLYTNPCSHNHNTVSPYRYTSLTIPVMPPKKFRNEQAEILRCKRRVDLSHKLGYKSHPTAVARRNERERNRVKHINSTFSTLRQHIPCAAKNKKMSKVETLRSAIRYINHLQHILDSQSSSQDGLETLEGPGRLQSQSSCQSSNASTSPGSHLNSSTSLQDQSHPGSMALLSPPATPDSDHSCSTPGSSDPRDSYYGHHLEEGVEGLEEAEVDEEEEEEEEEEVGGLSQFADWF